MSEKVTAQQLAEMINGREYRDELPKELADIAIDNDLVVVYGASDDLIEFDGAAVEEYSAYNGATIPVGKDGEPIFGCDEPCNHCRAVDEANEAKTNVEAKWNEQGYSWFISVNIADYLVGTFDILEDGQKYCRGVVFSVKDIE